MWIKDKLFSLLPKQTYFNNIFRFFPAYFDGEKSPNEQGQSYEAEYDYYTIRQRAIALFLRNGNVRNLVSKYNLWLIGTGLSLQSNPKDSILEKRGIVIENRDKWTDFVDESFNLWAKDTHCSLDRRTNLHGIARKVVENGAFFAGDVFVICYYDKKEGVMVELVDGGDIKSPPGAKDNIIDGIELDKSNRMIAFWIDKKNNNFVRVPCYNDNGQEVAWAIFGHTGKLSSVRGLSMLAQQLDYVKKVDEFAEALIKNAKENANFVATIEHGVNSTGDNPIKNNKSAIQYKGSPNSNTILCDSPEQIRAKMSRISEGAVLNLGTDQTFKRFNGEGSNSDSAKFHRDMNDLFYSNEGLPPEVARNQFEGSYSSSRMIGKTWEFEFMTMREVLLIEQLYNKIFLFWFEIQVAKGEIKAPKYFAFDRTGKQAYTNKTFRGPTMPHVDPLKEVTAARKILGPLFDNTPLADLDSVIEKISNSDSSQVLQLSKKELEKTKEFRDLGIDLEKSKQPSANINDNNDNNNEDESDD